MTPKTTGSHACPASRSKWEPPQTRGRLALEERFMTQNYQMTLCGSEVPQDRWRGRTAGSGMWTLTRDNLLSWSLDDPAIPYG